MFLGNVTTKIVRSFEQIETMFALVFQFVVLSVFALLALLMDEKLSRTRASFAAKVAVNRQNTRILRKSGRFF